MACLPGDVLGLAIIACEAAKWLTLSRLGVNRVTMLSYYSYRDLEDSSDFFEERVLLPIMCGYHTLNWGCGLSS